jgi:hypothetical protein
MAINQLWKLNKRVEEAEPCFPLPALLFSYELFDISQVPDYN